MPMPCWISVFGSTQIPLAIHDFGSSLTATVLGFLQFVVAALLASVACSVDPGAGCRVLAQGSRDLLLLKGTVLTSGGALNESYVLVQSGKIACVGEDCHAPHATVVECTNSVISPGFINTHEHIAYSTARPLEDIGERVDHRHHWRVGLGNHTRRKVDVNGTLADASKWGELRHLFSGTTSIVGGDMVPGLVRNLDFAAGLEDDLHAPASIWDVFPLDDSVGIVRSGDCDYGFAPIDMKTAAKLPRYMAHIGEGVGAEAANEFQCLANETFDVTPVAGGGGVSIDIIAPNLALIHALGLTKADLSLVASRGAHIVWSPRSNVFLYGKTLNVTYLLEAGVNVALGSDWLPSGSATMQREAACAFSVTRNSYGQTLGAQTIWQMMTENAAKAANFDESLGSLEAGKLADIIVVSGAKGDPFSQAIYAPEEHIELVVRGGKVLVAGSRLEGLAVGSCEAVMFGTAQKFICVEDELGSTYAAFEESLGGVYPAILPGVPPGEPSCEPTR